MSEESKEVESVPFIGTLFVGAVLFFLIIYAAWQGMDNFLYLNTILLTVLALGNKAIS